MWTHAASSPRKFGKNQPNTHCSHNLQNPNLHEAHLLGLDMNRACPSYGTVYTVYMPTSVYMPTMKRSNNFISTVGSSLIVTVHALHWWFQAANNNNPPSNRETNSIEKEWKHPQRKRKWNKSAQSNRSKKTLPNLSHESNFQTVISQYLQVHLALFVGRGSNTCSGHYIQCMCTQQEREKQRTESIYCHLQREKHLRSDHWPNSNLPTDRTGKRYWRSAAE